MGDPEAPVRLGGTGAPVPRRTLGCAFKMDEELPLVVKAGPPRVLTVAADALNLAAGVFLTFAFMLLVLMIAAEAWAPFKPDGTPSGGFQVMTAFMCMEGICYCAAGLLLTYINIQHGDTSGIVSQVIIAFGGLFFALSAFGNPTSVMSPRYVFSFPADTPNASVLNAMAHYGITCFMVATSLGFTGVWRLDKSQLISPFWGVTFFLLGAWTIGLFVFWIPTFAGGDASYDGLPASDATKCAALDAQICKMLAMPAGAWAWKHYFGVLGAGFLTLGAYIFAGLDEVI